MNNMEIAGFRSKYTDEQIEALLDAAANGGGGGGGDVVYFAVDMTSSGVKDFLLACGQYILNCRCETGTNVMVNCGTPYAYQNSTRLFSISVTASPVKTVTKYGSSIYESEKTYQQDAMFQHYISAGELWSITEEEFYNIN